MKEMEMLKQEVRDVLENNILRFWIDRMQDDEHGADSLDALTIITYSMQMQTREPS